MSQPLRKMKPLFIVLNNLMIDLPTPQNISIWWNLGSTMALTLIMQILSGLFLAMFYVPDINLAFSSTVHIMRDINFGWLLRNLHANGASLFFICIYIHIARGIYYLSFRMMQTWNIGVLIYISLMGTAFLGYVLPWGQMSFWGATVITSLLSAIPKIGPQLVVWVWGGFAVDAPTLTRFFALHFILPFIIMALSIIHIVMLHTTGSNNPLGKYSNLIKIPMHPFFTTKDIMGFSLILMIFSFIVLFKPNLLSDPENFIMANPLVTPIHIKPEWYFLWLYAILRSIPNKLGGVMMMFTSMIILMTFPLFMDYKMPSMAFYPISQMFVWSFFVIILLLTWIGGCPVEYPYEMMGLTMTMSYYLMISMITITTKTWDKTK